MTRAEVGRPIVLTTTLLVLLLLLGGAVTAQGPPAQQPPPSSSPGSPGAAPAGVAVERSGRSVPVTFFNREIVVLRARVLGREPEERADGVARALDDLVSQRITGPVETRAMEGGWLVSVGSRGILVLTAADVEAGPEGTGPTVETAAGQMADRVRSVLADAVASRSWLVLLRGSAEAAAGLVVGGLLLVGITRARRITSGRLTHLAERKVTQSGIADVRTLRASRLVDVANWLVGGLALILNIVVVYAVVTFVLRRFAYTRPWGTSMRGFLVTTLENLALGITRAVPGLVTVAIIVIVARFLARLVALWFDAIARGYLKPRWIYPETALPTKRLMTGLVWIFAAVVAYPYIPGSDTDAFKGVSVFLGAMVTLGSSGLVNHIMSGLMITYSRALRVGDFVRIGDVEGTVIHLGVLSVKVRTPPNEEVTIPNAVVVAQTTIDYSRPGETAGVFIPTSVTIGYDAPWRQVHSLLLMAAERTDGVRREPKPYVLQAGLEDFYVKYTLFVCLQRQKERPFVLDRLHAHIQDLFNEYGVQIMSPNYVIDPAAPKVVAKSQWHAAPAPPETAPTAEPSPRRSG